MNTAQIEKITYNNTALAEREMHSEKMLTKLYDLDKMQEGLMTAHNQLDLAVARCTVTSRLRAAKSVWNTCLNFTGK